MDECDLYNHLLTKIDRSKDDFLDWFEHLYEIDGKDEEIYEVIISWSNQKTVDFAKWFDWNLDRIRLRIYQWDKEYIEIDTEKNPVFAGQSFSEKKII